MYAEHVKQLLNILEQPSRSHRVPDSEPKSSRMRELRPVSCVIMNVATGTPAPAPTDTIVCQGI